MTQIYPVPPTPVPSRDPAQTTASNSEHSARVGGGIVAAAWLLIAIAIAPVSVCADAITVDSTPAADDGPLMEDEGPDTGDDGSSALRDIYKSYNLRDIEPIGAKEEEALLGNWGDTDAEDGD